MKRCLAQLQWNSRENANAALNGACQCTQSHESADARRFVVMQQFRRLLKLRLRQHFKREIGLHQNTEIQINIGQTINQNSRRLNNCRIGMYPSTIIVESAEHIPAFRPEKL